MVTNAAIVDNRDGHSCARPASQPAATAPTSRIHNVIVSTNAAYGAASIARLLFQPDAIFREEFYAGGF